MKRILNIALLLIFFSSALAQEKVKATPADLTKLLSEEVQKEINFVRQNPDRYRKIIKDAGRLDSTRYDEDKWGKWFIKVEERNYSVTVTTHEGILAYQEADSFLFHQEKLEPYKFEKGLRAEAKMQCEYLSSSGKFTHDRPGGAEMNYLDKLEGDIKLIGENLGKLQYVIRIKEYTEEELKKKVKDIAQRLILQWIVDDGIESRGHRDVLFYTIHKYFGAYCLVDEHGTVICAVEFSNKPFKK